MTGAGTLLLLPVELDGTSVRTAFQRYCNNRAVSFSPPSNTGDRYTPHATAKPIENALVDPWPTNPTISVTVRAMAVTVETPASHTSLAFTSAAHPTAANATKPISASNE